MGTVKYSGPVASFHCPTEATIRSLKVHFSPKQLGEGTPSPENVREIEGWEGVEVQRCGENLFPAAAYTRTASGITFTYYPNGDVHIEGTATANCFMNVPSTMYFTITPGMYTISGNINNSNVFLYLVVSSENGEDIKFSTTSSTPSTKEITFTDNSARAQISVQSGRTVNVTIHPKLERGSYTANTIINYEFGVLGKNKFDGEYPNIKNSTKLTYRSIYVGNQIITASSNMPKTTEHHWSNLFILPGQVTSGAATRTNDFNVEVSRTITPIDGWVTIAYRNEEGIDPRNYQVQLELGSTATTYEPYDSNKTVYGGALDVVRGTLTADRAMVDLGTLNYSRRSSSDGTFVFTTGGFAGKKTGIANIISDCLLATTITSWTNAKPNNSICGSATSTTVVIRADSYENANDLKTALSGHHAVYELTTPITYHLAPTQLQTFLGQNNVWSNADYVEVEYDLHETQDILARKQFIMANQPHIVKPAAAPLQNFVTDVPAPLKECKVHFAPVQNGTGDPSPDNVRAITGWAGLTTYYSGENLYIPNINNKGFINASGAIKDSTTSTYTDLIPVTAGEIYSFKCTTARVNQQSTNRRLHGYDNDGNWIRQIAFKTTDAATVEDVSLVEAIPSDISYIRVSFRNQDTNVRVAKENVVSVNWSTEAGTIYGGYVDLVTGEVWAEWKYIDFITADWTQFSVGTSVITVSLFPGTISSRNNGFCNILPMVSNPNVSGVEGVDWNNGRLNLCLSVSRGISTLADFKAWLQTLKDGGVTPCIVAKYGEPSLVTTLTPTQLKTLRGTNNIWSNAGDITLSYWKH